MRRITPSPQSFIAYLFDDIHLHFADLAQVRDGAGRNIDAPRSSLHRGKAVQVRLNGETTERHAINSVRHAINSVRHAINSVRHGINAELHAINVNS